MDSTTGGILGIFGFLISGAGAIYAAINHKKMRCRCCGKDLDVSVDIDETDVVKKPKKKKKTAKVEPEESPPEETSEAEEEEEADEEEEVPPPTPPLKKHRRGSQTYAESQA